MKFIREIIDCFRFFWKTTDKEKEIVFYSENEAYFPNFEGLVTELNTNYKKTICYITSDAKDPILKKANPLLKTFYINRLLTFFMALVRCRFFIMTLTDLGQLHIKRSIHPVHYIYVFHSMVSTHMMYRFGAFDHYDSILCVGPFQREEIRKFEKMHSLSPKKLVDAGYYRLERIYQKYKNIEAQLKEKAAKPTILIAPSWGEKHVLESCGEALIASLLEKNYKVIVRPHPETVRRDPGLLKKLSKKFDVNPDFFLEKSVATDDSLLKADVLICDCSGVALEYAFGTERPVLSIDVPVKIKNEKYQELGITPLELDLRSKIGTIVSPETLDDVPKTIEQLLSTRTEYSEKIRLLREENIVAFGQSSSVGAKYIMDLCNQDINVEKEAC